MNGFESKKEITVLDSFKNDFKIFYMYILRLSLFFKKNIVFPFFMNIDLREAVFN